MPSDSITVGSSTTLVTPMTSTRKRRRIFVACNTSDEDIYLCDDLAQSVHGILLKANGGTFIDSPDNRGYLYQGAWHAICASGGKVLSILEQFYPASVA